MKTATIATLALSITLAACGSADTETVSLDAETVAVLTDTGWSADTIERASRTYANTYALENSDRCKPAGYTVWMKGGEVRYVVSRYNAEETCR